MKIPLIPDKKDPIWILFAKVVKVIDSDNFKEELSRNGLKPIKSHQTMLKIVILSMFFKLDIVHVYNQVNKKPKLFKFLKIEELPSLKQLREIYSRHSEDKYLELTLKILNKLNFKKMRNLKTIVIDSTSITLDLKFSGRYLSKQMLLDKDYKRGYSTNKGHYAGFQLTLAMEYKTCRPLALLINPGSPNDTKMFDDILHELKRRRLLREGQLILCDRGFYSFDNYMIGINKYKNSSISVSKEETIFNNIN